MLLFDEIVKDHPIIQYCFIDNDYNSTPHGQNHNDNVAHMAASESSFCIGQSALMTCYFHKSNPWVIITLQ